MLTDANQLSFLVLIGSVLGTFATMFTVFAVWLCSLTDTLHVHAPLLDGPLPIHR